MDFKKVKHQEREAAKALFKTKEGKTQLKDIQRKAKTFVPGEPLPEATNRSTNPAGLTPEQVGVSIINCTDETHSKHTHQNKDYYAYSISFA